MTCCSPCASSAEPRSMHSAGGMPPTDSWKALPLRRRPPVRVSSGNRAASVATSSTRTTTPSTGWSMLPRARRTWRLRPCPRRPPRHRRASPRRPARRRTRRPMSAPRRPSRQARIRPQRRARAHRRSRVPLQSRHPLRSRRPQLLLRLLRNPQQRPRPRLTRAPRRRPRHRRHPVRVPALSPSPMLVRCPMARV